MKYFNHIPFFLLFAPVAWSAIDISTVVVGDPGNANDDTDLGGVSYSYRIGTYEVTNSQYTTFLNAKASSDPYGLYSSEMGSPSLGGIDQMGSDGNYSYSVKTGFENKPVNYVSFWDAARFTNWLTTGGTENGVYDLNGVIAPTSGVIERNMEAWNKGGVAIASENEWYKAAYYQPAGAGGPTDSYWTYPTASNSITTADANYGNSVGTLTDAGTYAGSTSYYGTHDQGGNVWEWNDTEDATQRGFRGGSYADASDALRATDRNFIDPDGEGADLGFRVSSLEPIPEPSAYAAILGCLGLTIALTRRRGRSTL